MYRIVVLTMFVLPLCATVIEHFLHPEILVLALVAKWFVFWAIGVRLLMAGVMQVARPTVTARTIFRLKTDEALPLVREVGIGNLAGGFVGIASIAYPPFVFPIAVWGVIFYGGAALGHAVRRERSFNENAAMLTDFFAFVVLAVIVAWKAWPR